MAYNRRLWKREAEEKIEGFPSTTSAPTVDPTEDAAKAFKQHHHHKLTTTNQSAGIVHSTACN